MCVWLFCRSLCVHVYVCVCVWLFCGSLCVHVRVALVPVRPVFRLHPLHELTQLGELLCKINMNHSIQWWIQDFPEVEAPTLGDGRQHTILPNFQQNCMELKGFGPQGVRIPRVPLDPPLQSNGGVIFMKTSKM